MKCKNIKRNNHFKRWLSRNRLYFALWFIVLFCFGTGYILGTYHIIQNIPSQATIEPVIRPTIAIVNQPIIEDKPIYYNVPLDVKVQDFIRKVCKETNTPIELVLALIETESSFCSDVVSKTNDYGLMQINESNHDWLQEQYGITDFLDPYQNIFCGISILAPYLEKYDSVEKALMAYNMGESGAKKQWDKGVLSTSYTNKVMGRIDKYVQ